MHFSNLRGNIVLCCGYNFIVSSTDKPVVKVQKRPAQNSAAGEILLICVADGNPAPKMTWVFEGTVIADNHNITNNNNSNNHDSKTRDKYNSNNTTLEDVIVRRNDGINNNSAVSGDEDSKDKPQTGRDENGYVLVHKVSRLDGVDVRIYTCTAENTEGTAYGLLTVNVIPGENIATAIHLV